MVIGNGMVATLFESYKTNEDFIIFAAGVSNSKNTDSTAYNRETQLLINTIEKYKNKTLVYFSTCSLYDPEEKNSPYVLHKRKLEDFIRQHVANYYIFRVSNIVGKSSNPNTILNFFYYHITNRINFDLWSNSSRNLIDMDDLYLIADHLLKNRMFKNQIIDIANPDSYNVKDIITGLETALGIKANYISISKGSRYSIDISLILPIIRELKINFSEKYLSHLIKKYYLQ